MNGAQLKLVKALAIRRAQLWNARMCVIQAINTDMVNDDTRKMLNNMWRDLDDIIEKEDAKLDFWTTEEEEEEE